MSLSGPARVDTYTFSPWQGCALSAATELEVAGRAKPLKGRSGEPMRSRDLAASHVSTATKAKPEHSSSRSAPPLDWADGETIPLSQSKIENLATAGLGCALSGAPPANEEPQKKLGRRFSFSSGQVSR